MATNSEAKLIHLLYVPTLACNMGCSYCYLEEKTRITVDNSINHADILHHAIDKFAQANIIPFNISIHGGEATVLSASALEDIFNVIKQHYLKHYDILNSRGFRKYVPHIKTNLLNFDKHYELFNRHQVSVSGSVDIPLNLHDKYRINRANKSTLPKILDNLKLLANYKFNKKISSTLYNEHINQYEQIVKDIWYIHNDIGFDMNNFNFMFGFLNENQENNGLLSQIPDNKQLEFYNKINKEFLSTELEYGLRRNWFDEFTPDYCTGSVNCGEKFFLLQWNGNIYSCVRGQGDKDFLYGNINTDDAETIIDNARNIILQHHRNHGFHDDCDDCNHLHRCNTGCPYVKKMNSKAKSYTCKLQLGIYDDNPIAYPPIVPEYKDIYKQQYLFNIHPQIADNKTNNLPQSRTIITNELYTADNSLLDLIEKDNVLKVLYSNEMLKLELDNETINLESQILKEKRDLHILNSQSELMLHINHKFFEAACKELVRNTLYIQLLNDNLIVYGDEQRTKQRHITTHQIFYSELSKSDVYDNHLMFDLGKLLHYHAEYFTSDIANNLFVTTNDLRNYHYDKQKNNAFYHIQAINLPFQNFEFYYL